MTDVVSQGPSDQIQGQEEVEGTKLQPTPISNIVQEEVEDEIAIASARADDGLDPKPKPPLRILKGNTVGTLSNTAIDTH